MRWFHNHPVVHNSHHVIPSLTGNLLAVLLAVALAVSCGGPEPVNPNPDPTTPVTPVTPEKDTQAPVITVSTSTVNVIAGPAVTVSGSELKIGNESVATWKDDKSATCTIVLTFTPTEGTAKTLNSWDKVSEAGKLQIKATDEAGNSATAEITLTREDSQAPTLEVKIAEKNVIAGVTVTIQGNQLLFDNEVAAIWTDNFTTECKLELTFTPQGSSEAKPVASGDKLSEAGTLKLTVADEFDNKATVEISLTRVDNQAPTIDVKIAETNVIAGVTATVQGNQLLFNEAVAATWTDDYTESCEIGLSLTSAESAEVKAIASGDILSEAGTLKLTVTDEFGNSATAEIKLTAVAVYGLENLQNKQLWVDQEVNLLEGVTFAEGLTLAKVEAEQDGIRTEVVNPHAFVPEYPGSVDIILTLSKPDGNTLTVNTGNLTVKPLEYSVIVLKTADVINSQYAWFNNIQSQSKKAFVYPHLLTSYITGERYRLDNLEYIVAWEIPEYTQEYPNVWSNLTTPDRHADMSCAHVKETAAPLSTIKVCGWSWIDLLNYINLHPDKHFMISCARDKLSWNTLAQLQGNEKYTALKTILLKKNVTLIIATTNYIKYTINEGEPDREWWHRNSASVNGPYPNKITASGFDTEKNNIFRDDHVWSEPLWFSKERNNIVIPFTNLVAQDGKTEVTWTESSFPTAAISGTLWNFLSIIMRNRPGITLADADSIFWDEFLIPQYFQHKNDDGTIENAGIWYFFNTEKFFDVEILHKADILQALSSAAPISSATAETHSVALPTYPGLIYEGPGIYFTANEQEHEMTGTNRAALESAVKSGMDLTWRYSPARARKYGIPPSLTVHVLDTKAQIVPDVTFSVELK